MLGFSPLADTPLAALPGVFVVVTPDRIGGLLLADPLARRLAVNDLRRELLADNLQRKLEPET